MMMTAMIALGLGGLMLLARTPIQEMKGAPVPVRKDEQ